MRELFAHLREALVDLALTRLELLLPAAGLLLELGLVLSDQLLDARLLDLALHAREVGVQRRDDPLGLARVELRGGRPPLAQEQHHHQGDQDDQEEREHVKHGRRLWAAVRREKRRRYACAAACSPVACSTTFWARWAGISS